jgi:hypothetical protein
MNNEAFQRDQDAYRARVPLHTGLFGAKSTNPYSWEREAYKHTLFFDGRLAARNEDVASGLRRYIEFAS